MVKLIVSDMDGSLLDGQRGLPPDFEAVFARLTERGIPFVIASGRSFVSLKQYFARMPGTPACICDNGAYVIDGGEVSDIREIPRAKLLRFLQACEGLSDICTVLCGLRGTYYIPDGSAFSGTIDEFYDNAVVVDDLYAVDDVIFKIGLEDLKKPQTNSLPWLTQRMGDALSIRISGSHWMDITDEGVNKGAALRRLQTRLGITPEETMVFGDNYNDIELWGCAHYSFVMENAAPELRRYGRFLAKSNREYGVTAAIRQHVLSDPLSACTGSRAI